MKEEVTTNEGIPAAVDAGIRLRESHKLMRRRARQAALAELGVPLEQAYSLAYQAVAMAALQQEGQLIELGGRVDRTGPILAAFLVGLQLVEEAILEGFNVQSSALLRQEVEAIAALEEIRRGRRIDGQTPNIRFVETLSGRIYGGLSNAAHLSHHATLRDLVGMQMNQQDDEELGSIAGDLMSPQHIPETTRRMFGIHTLLMLHFVDHYSTYLQEFHGVTLAAEAIDIANEAVQMLRDAGVVTIG